VVPWNIEWAQAVRQVKEMVVHVFLESVKPAELVDPIDQGMVLSQKCRVSPVPRVGTDL